MNRYLKYFYFVLEAQSNKCCPIQLLCTISFLAVFLCLIIPVCSAQFWGFFLLVRCFSFCLILPIFSLFPMDANYYTMLLECEKVLLANFARFHIWAITVLLLVLFVPFHHLFSIVLFLRGDDNGDFEIHISLSVEVFYVCYLMQVLLGHCCVMYFHV